MSNNNTFTIVGGPTKEELKAYDEICGAMLVNLFTRSKDWETIDLAGFDPKNQEHLFVLGVARGLAGAFSKKVRVDVNWRQLRRLNKGIDKDSRLLSFDSSTGVSIDVPTILNFMRPAAVEATNNEAIFSCIYREYYARKGK